MSGQISADGPTAEQAAPEPGTDIALVGMAGRFPGAQDVRSLWHNLRAARESISRFTAEELRASGVPEELLADPSYVRAGSVIDGIDLFDAGFFGYTPKEAQLLDPQQRLFLEHAWHALEDAGLDPARQDGAIGVVAGTGHSSYMMQNLITRPDVLEVVGDVQMGLGNDKDSLATRVAYALNLTGPCFTVQSYCSTSLVAVSLACSALASGEADVMLAGGISVLVPHRVGYLYQEAGMTSPDGRCRAFDAAAQGTPVGSGVGVVVLRRLEDALADGDRVYAVIRGWAVTNDGANKVGFTAPGVHGQASVMAEALASAGLSAADIDYVEAHGTGTGLGDAVEISALQRIFDVDDAGHCAIGSVKTNLGHLDRAAGVTSLIKTALSLYHEEIPATLNYRQPNAQLMSSANRIEVVTRLRPWPHGDRPRRAGVSAFGMGGTNAHVVLEEAPRPDEANRPAARPSQLLVWSARTAEAADALAERLREVITGTGEDGVEPDPGAGIADVAYTLQTGRALFEHRRAIVIADAADAEKALGADAGHRVLARRDAAVQRPVGFLLAGVGEHYDGMIGGLYRSEPVFRAAVDECTEVFRDQLGTDPVATLTSERQVGRAPDLAVLLGRTEPDAAEDPGVAATEIGQPAMFAADYALGRLLMHWGIRPTVLLGYSVGEFAAACLAGTLTLREAASLTAVRARLISSLPAGVMTAVPLSVAGITDRIGPPAVKGVDIAAINGPSVTVLSGPADAVNAVSEQLSALGIPSRPLRTTHAFHSAALREIAPELTAWARSELRPRDPQIPYLSNVTGRPITGQQLSDPGYWAEHMCRTVQFSEMLSYALGTGHDLMLVEIGPGQSLGAMARNHPGCSPERWPLLLPTLAAEADPASDETTLTGALAQLWLAGVGIDWQAYHEGRAPRKTAVPHYPFQRERYWVDRATPVATATAPATPTPTSPAATVTHELLVPRWTARPLPATAELVPSDAPIWVLADDRGVAESLTARLSAGGHRHVLVRPAGRAGHTVRPGEQADYARLLQTGPAPQAVVHLWGLDSSASPGPDGDRGGPGPAIGARELGFDSLRALTAALGEADIGAVRVLVVTDSARAVLADDRPVPERTTVFGPCLVAPQEYPSLDVRTLDTDTATTPSALAAAVHGELWADGADRMAAIRAGTRLTLDYVSAPAPDAPDVLAPVTPDRGSVCLITGGLGPVGLLLAGHLGRTRGAKLVLTGRRGLPPREEWDRIVADDEAEPELRNRIGALRRLAEEGISVEAVAADAADEARLREVVENTMRRYGRLDGVIHLAAVTDPLSLSPLAQLSEADRDAHFSAKAGGALVLEKVLADLPVRFCLLFSSMSTVLGGIGLGSYAAANSFLDALAYRHHEDATRWIAADWDTWPSTASSVTGAQFGSSLARYSLTEQRALAAFDQILACPQPRTVVSAGELPARLAEWVERPPVPEAARPAGDRFPRPDLAQQYVPPAGERQRRLAEVWAELLGVDRVGARDNFSDLGGTSLMALQLVKRINSAFGVKISPVTLFEAPTVHAMAQMIQRLDGGVESTAGLKGSGASARTAQRPAAAAAPSDHIAIIGLSARLPGAQNTDAFWCNLRDGVESVTRFSEEELVASGVPLGKVRDPDYVAARPVLDDIRSFDAAFFGYSPRDAAITDPQHRLFLECCWEALEDGGYGAAADRGRVGVFGGANLSTYLMLQAPSLADANEADVYTAVIGNGADSLATSVSYKLGLTGPSLSVQTFCSTALVGVHLAAQSLRGGECEMALAGGVGIHVPDRVGHQYLPGGMESPDGRVRTFDAAARGTLFGDGCGVLLLKRLDDALADGDTVHAVIRGSAVNNDGSLKAGYTAPSVVGQAAVVSDAMAAAGVTAEDISYVEAHGTATELGDPIEVTALTRAFGDTENKQYCPIGSVKTNIGHLGAAAGATGLIKTVLALKHRQIPASLHFSEPNPEIDFPGSPFYVNTELAAWQVPEGRRRIAGVNSLGMGGTNVHVVIEEPPEPPKPPEPTGPGLERRYEILPVSARTQDAADLAVARLGGYLRREPLPRPLDVAFTLQAGREQFEHRRVLVTGSLDALRGLQDGDGTLSGLLSRTDAVLDRPVNFLFAGVGEQYPGMLSELYRREPEFRAAVDECADVLREVLATDLTGLLTAPREGVRAEDPMLVMAGRVDSGDDPAATDLARTEIAQPAAFVTGYACARMLMSWGVQPATMLGYSLGEYIAACLAGVLSLPDTLRLVAFRAQLISRLPAGRMLALPLSPEQLDTRFGPLGSLGIDIAVVNGPELTVVGGDGEAIGALAARLESAGVPRKTLATTHAFHTRMLKPVQAELTAWVTANLRPKAPTRPYLSNLTGDMATAELVADPDYWARHMCSTVRFADGLTRLLDDPDPVLMEIGPGQSLGAMVRSHPACPPARWPLIVSTLPAAADQRPDDEVAAEALARLWLAGVNVNWAAYQQGRAPRRIPLPTYPFQRQDYWLDADVTLPAATQALVVGDRHLQPLPMLPEGDWLQAPVWRQTVPRGGRLRPARWLILTDTGPADEVCGPLVRRLTETGGSAVLARPATDENDFTVVDGEYRIRPGDAASARELMRHLRDEGGLPEHIVHLWTLSAVPAPRPLPSPTDLEAALVRGADTLVALAIAASDVGAEQWALDVVTSGTRVVIGTEQIRPELTTITGPVRGIPLEYPEVTCRLIDIDPVRPGTAEHAADRVATELGEESCEPVVVLRDGRRWLPSYEALPEHEPTGTGPLREGGVYLVTGGLGGIGLAMAERLARDCQARLVLFGRTGLPPRETWHAALADPAVSEEVLRRITGVMRIEELGAEVAIVTGDVSDLADIERAVRTALDRFGALHGVLHTAGLPGIGLMQFKTTAEMRKVMAPKTYGTIALEAALDGVPLDFLALFSSITSVTGGGPGQVDYSSANAFLDAWSEAAAVDGGRRTVTVGWGEWQWNAWGAGLAGYDPQLQELFRLNRQRFGIGFEEGWRLLLRALSQDQPYVVANSQDFSQYVQISRGFTVNAVGGAGSADSGEARHPRPDLVTAYVPPSGETERVIAEIWAELLGLRDIGANDSFFDLGGSSLIGMEVMARIRRRLSINELAPHVLYEAPTVAMLARLLTAAGTEGPAADAADTVARNQARSELRKRGLRGGRDREVQEA